MKAARFRGAEALYLIENRLSELQSLPMLDERVGARRRQFFVLKCALDAGIAALVAAGRYTAGIEARMMALKEDRTAFLDTMHLKLIARAASCRMTLEELFGENAEPIDEQEVVNLMTTVWTRIAAHLSGGELPQLVLDRCCDGNHATNLRQFIVVSRQCGRTRVAALLNGLQMMRFAPIASLRTAALISSLDTSAAGAYADLDHYLDGLTSYCGFSEGTREHRAFNMLQSIQ